jgi:23S rRNA pseudouridine1911/1915/1917 synthase
MAVHQGLGDYGNTAADFIKNHLKDQPPIYIVHRIDKHTSGALVFAKNLASLNFLNEQFINKTVQRIYYCLVWGNPKPSKGIIESYIGRNPENERSIEVSKDGAFGKNAITYFEAIENFQFASLVKCKLETGRTHQIRIHMRSIGHALISDQRYPNENPKIPQNLIEKAAQILPNQALHAFSLKFINPTDKKVLYFEVPFPPAFEELKEYLKKRNH